MSFQALANSAHEEYQKSNPVERYFSGSRHQTGSEPKTNSSPPQGNSQGNSQFYDRKKLEDQLFSDFSSGTDQNSFSNEVENFSEFPQSNLDDEVGFPTPVVNSNNHPYTEDDDLAYHTGNLSLQNPNNNSLMGSTKSVHSQFGNNNNYNQQLQQNGNNNQTPGSGYNNGGRDGKPPMNFEGGNAYSALSRSASLNVNTTNGVAEGGVGGVGIGGGSSKMSPHANVFRSAQHQQQQQQQEDYAGQGSGGGGMNHHMQQQQHAGGGTAAFSPYGGMSHNVVGRGGDMYPGSAGATSEPFHNDHTMRNTGNTQGGYGGGVGGGNGYNTPQQYTPGGRPYGGVGGGVGVNRHASHHDFSPNSSVGYRGGHDDYGNNHSYGGARGGGGYGGGGGGGYGNHHSQGGYGANQFAERDGRGGFYGPSPFDIPGGFRGVQNTGYGGMGGGYGGGGHSGGAAYRDHSPHSTAAASPYAALAGLTPQQTSLGNVGGGGGYMQQEEQPSTVYVVAFKTTCKDYVIGMRMTNEPINAGDAVIVAVERGEDLGVVSHTLTIEEFMLERFQVREIPPHFNVNRYCGSIIRLATPREVRMLKMKSADEDEVLEYARHLVDNTYHIKMSVFNAEYQFDRQKIIIYYDSKQKVNYQQFVKDIHSFAKARVWMERVIQN